MWTDGHMMKPIVAVRNFANAPKKNARPLIKKKKKSKLLGMISVLPTLGHKTAVSCFHSANRQLSTFSSIKTKNRGCGWALAVNPDVRDSFTGRYQLTQIIETLL